MAHTYNPSYSGGKEQEDHGLNPAQANSSWDPISRKPCTKKDLEPLYQPFFVMDFFKIGPHELFAWADFKPWSFWSLPPE
jgi:hypothetical protein